VLIRRNPRHVAHILVASQGLSQAQSALENI